MNEEEKKEIKELINLLYNNHISQYGKRKLENYIKELQKELDKKDKVIVELKNKLEEHISFCEQEAKGHLNNNVCHISLRTDKHLLEIIKKVEEENDVIDRIS